jgi:hypothetical protein
MRLSGPCSRPINSQNRTQGLCICSQELWPLDNRSGHKRESSCKFVMIFLMTLPAHSGPLPIIQFRNHFSQTVGLLGRVINPSQGLYLNTWQHKQNKRIHTPNIHALSGIRTHDPSVRASEDSSCLRQRGYCDRQICWLRWLQWYKALCSS